MGESQVDMTRIQQLMVDGWAVYRQTVMYARYKKANPREAARLEAYWSDGGSPPTAATLTGRALALFAKARWT